MTRLRLWLLPLAGLLSLTAAAPAADATDDQDRDVLALAAKIDKFIGAGWTAAGARPTPPADDSEFLRRTYLDVAGRIPAVSEVREFLDDARPNKRLLLIKRLLDGPRYVTHWTTVWRSLLLPEANASYQARFLVPGFEGWIRDQLVKNAAYDKMVRDLLTTPVGGEGMNRIYAFQGGASPSPLGYFIAKELKPENLAASTARTFLGVRLECAQCHAHPFADWTRDQFWEYAAFFAGIKAQNQGDFITPGQENRERREITIPNSDKVVQATFLDGSTPEWKFKAPVRQTLAEWITAPKNPYFARATVNRMWAYFFGTPIVEPIDEMVGADSTNSHPQLLEELAKEFVAHKYDLKFLIRAITASQAYQLSSVMTDKSQEGAHLFAKMSLRGLSPEQLYDSVATATGFQDNSNPQQVFFGGRNSPKGEFLSKFASQGDKPTDVQTSILQALALMNGKIVTDATHLDRSELLLAVVDAPFLDTAGRVEALYLATLSRRPTSRELGRLTAYVEGGGAPVVPLSPYLDNNGKPLAQKPTPAELQKRSREALADVFWALLNSGEFLLNH